MGNQLVANNLSKSFAQRVIFSDISFSVAQGQIVGLLGSNGCGKTTCFYTLAGMMRADYGQVLLRTRQGEIDLTHLPMHKRARLGLGYLPQNSSIFQNLTAEDNIMAILELRKDLTKQQRQQKLEELLDNFQVQPIRRVHGRHLSGGERRRIEIARILAFDPYVVLLDEPLAAIDPITIENIKGMIRYLKKRQIGVLITDHNVNELLTLCDYFYILGNHKIMMSGNSQEVMTDAYVRKHYLGDNFHLKHPLP